MTVNNWAIRFPRKQNRQRTSLKREKKNYLSNLKRSKALRRANVTLRKANRLIEVSSILRQWIEVKHERHKLLMVPKDNEIAVNVVKRWSEVRYCSNKFRA